MRTLLRILFERKTRRFLDAMIHKYADIRLSSTARQLPRKRWRSGELDYSRARDNKAEASISPASRTASACSSCPRLSERNHQRKEHQPRHQLDAAQVESWRESDLRAVSEFGSSSTKLTRLIREDETATHSCTFGSLHDSRSEEKQESCSSFIEREAVSTNGSAVASAQSSESNQQEMRSELPMSDTPSSPLSTTTRLPRSKPTTSVDLIRPDCCDLCTSPCLHYEKEKIGRSRGLVHSDSSQTNSTSAEISNNENDQSTTTDDTQDSDEFDMWDYVCPQYTRRIYLNEWV